MKQIPLKSLLSFQNPLVRFTPAREAFSLANWSHLSNLLAQHLTPVSSALEGQPFAAGMRVRDQNTSKGLSIKGESLFFLSFKLNDDSRPLYEDGDGDCFGYHLEKTDIHTTYHNHTTHPLPGMADIFGNLVGRQDIPAALNTICAKEPDTHTVGSWDRIALFSSYGIVLVQDGYPGFLDEDGGWGRALQNNNAEQQCYCRLGLPTPQTGHDHLAQYTAIDNLTLLANLYMIASHSGTRVRLC